MVKLPSYSLNAMSTSKQTCYLKYLFLWLLISLPLISCGQGNQADQSIPILNDKNIAKFSLQFADDHHKTLDSLVKGFHTYRKAGNSYGFTLYRNHEWTPDYIEKKNYYSAVFKKNKDYLATKSATITLFDSFENIIFLGIGLKHALSKKDKALMEQTLKSIKQDKEIVYSIIKSAGLESKFKRLQKSKK